MGLNDAPSGERIHIGFFGMRNAGKSSLVNAVTGQKLSIVSEKKGTTTDPVKKAMEILPLGPVVITDTPGFDDDDAELGKERVARAGEVLRRVDIAVVAVDSARAGEEAGKPALYPIESEFIEILKKREIPYIVCYTKSDLLSEASRKVKSENEIFVSARTGAGINELKEALGALLPEKKERRIVGDLIDKNDVVVLVTPIDESAPKGRLILPQVETIRDILDAGAICVTVQPEALADALEKLSEKPRLVITDSQAFQDVARIVPNDIMLTSFSILMARYKGFLESAVKGISALEALKPGDKILIAEGCTHHRQCNDIGTVKIPRFIREFTNSEVKIETCSGQSFPEDLSPYRLVLHCGGCMLNEKEVGYRMRSAEAQGVPFLNYGLTIAYMKGVFPRALEIFPEYAI